MRSLLIPLELAANARGLQLTVDLDRNIDWVRSCSLRSQYSADVIQIARRALYHAKGLSAEEIAKRMAIDNDEDGIVVGDEMRLRQIVTNLTS